MLSDHNNKIIYEINEIIFSTNELDLYLYKSLYKKLHQLHNSWVKKTLMSKLKTITRSVHELDTIDIKTRCEWYSAQIASHFNATYKTHKENAPIYHQSISKYDWSKLEQYWIKSIEEEQVYYRGGVARIIGQILLWYGTSAEELSTLTDIDLIVTKPYDHELLMQHYWAKSEWVMCITKECDPDLLTQMFDLGMNEVVVGKDTIHMSSNFLEYAKNKISIMRGHGVDSYWVKSYEVNGVKVFDPNDLGRGMKFLIEWKLQTLKVPAFNIIKKNLGILWFESEIISLVRKFIGKKHATKYLYNLAQFLIDWNYISKHQEIFQLTDTLLSKYHRSLLWKHTGIEFDVRYKLTKVAKREYISSIWFDKYVYSKTHWLDLADRQEIMLTCPNLDPTQEFIIQYNTWIQTVR